MTYLIIYELGNLARSKTVSQRTAAAWMIMINYYQSARKQWGGGSGDAETCHIMMSMCGGATEQLQLCLNEKQNP